MNGRRVLLVITDLEIGGVPLHVFRLAGGLVARGYEIRVGSLAPAGPVTEMLHEAGVGTFACDAKSPLDLGAIGRLAGEIRDFEPDVVHSLLFHANVAARFASLRAGISRRRVICEIQTVEIERRWHLWVDHFTHPLCRIEVGNSPSVIEHLATRASLPRSKLRCVPGGVDADQIARADAIDKAREGVSGDGPLIVWAGRMDPIKGLDNLIAAFARVRRGHASHLALLGDGPIRPTVEQQVRQLGLSDAVTFTGMRDDVASWLKAAAVFVFPSRTEGMPNALLEAMAAGCAVVTSDVPGCRDLVTNEKTGLLVPPRDPAALAAAVERLLDDESLRRRLGDQAGREVEEKYTIDRMVGRYGELYEEVAGVRHCS